jgi:hypothetical protein
MESIGIIDKIFCYASQEFIDQIDPHIVMIHEESSREGETLIIRFTNGFGVKILKPEIANDPPAIFVVMVLSFLGSRIKEYKLAQYTSIPEVNWLTDQEDIIKLCREVSVLPASRRN